MIRYTVITRLDLPPLALRIIHNHSSPIPPNLPLDFQALDQRDRDPPVCAQRPSHRTPSPSPHYSTLPPNLIDCSINTWEKISFHMGNSGHLVFLALSKLFFTDIQFHLSSFSTFLDMKMQTELYQCKTKI